ncbi:putative polysaccharide ABC transporter ATP-binding protein [Flavihumibacter petaseus NBRC 106054]|uniref:Putative polysaccharide ABC transporter ATP-binding protein n=1 Tax=Flavihumibacter petaseus NBRC 106054 TaxID=1220578 RepID=A0A0E9N5V2_9BACT|nr:putative polysaccharide ABC transporter ATP-binding protein [Flavihumibacter petaseus NBRC 106054]
MRSKNSFFNTHNPGLSNSNAFYALNDISLNVNEGEVWGIVGPNGAGKSTLLKIVSRIIKPSSGQVLGKGKVSSLLEIGTGFHDELTGRENIFLSGYVLGMKKSEIIRNFDDIVEFSGIGEFVDTPVKRYSSGMYVRLAFAVAAFLEPDILIIDEVLAVGDAEFQKKCLGKMQEVTTQKGRTILFVSHNMQAVNQLCSKAVYLNGGRAVAIGDVHTVVNTYLTGMQKTNLHAFWQEPELAPGVPSLKVNSVSLIPQQSSPGTPLDIRTPFTCTIRFWNYEDGADLSVGLHLFTLTGECIFDVASPSIVCHEGLVEAECRIPGNFLNNGSYYLSIIFMKDTSVQVFYLEECIHFEVEDFRENMNWYGQWMGAVRPKFPFTIRQA